MERHRPFDNDRFRPSSDSSPTGDELSRQRGEIDGLLRAADHVFDSIDSLQAQQYLQQNLQTGGQ